MAVKRLDEQIGKVKNYSSVIETEPWGFKAETTFYNMVLIIETEFTPHQTLSGVLGIEKSLGRSRHGKEYTDRLIDIDILFYDELLIREENLVVPHPLMHKRRFVLQPLAEIAPGLVHPVLQTSIYDLLHALEDPGPISVVVERREFANKLNIKNPS